MSTTLAECRTEAIQKRDAAIAAISERYAEECRAEDAEFDAEFDRVREEFERVRKRPRPTMTLRAHAGTRLLQRPSNNSTPT
jgi:hypothetical protein